QKQRNNVSHLNNSASIYIFPFFHIQNPPIRIPPRYAAVRNGTKGNADFLVNPFAAIITAEKTAARRNAAVSTDKIFQNPRKLPMTRIRMLSPYPNASPVDLLIIKNRIPTAPPAVRRTAGISAAKIPLMTDAGIPASRSQRLSFLLLMSIQLSTIRYRRNKN